jgi:isopenicillin-N epimerase
MGSFHSEDVDTLMAQSDADYMPPALPFEKGSSIVDDDDKESDFLLDRQRWTFLNHGAFGAALKVGYYRAEEWRLHLERQPLRYFDRDLLPHLVYSARRLADFCHAPRDATTLIPNVTYGLSTILRGYTRRFERQSHIILWDTSYGSLKKMAHQLCPRVTEIPISSYFDKMDQFDNPSDIFEVALTETLSNIAIDTENALLILDHTTSNTAINMPLESLSKLGKERNMLVMVDGAHGLLAQPLELSNLPHVDFYLGNGHKWLSCPRGIGLLYCPNSDWRDTILEEPAVMSHGIGQGFQSRFLWDGCRDYGAALSVPAVLDYWQEKGVPQVQQDIRSNLHAAVELLGLEWHGHSEGVTLVPLELHAPMMALVRLPSSMQQKGGAASTSEDAKRIQDFLFDQFIEVPIKCIEGVLYVRISSHVYNELDEYSRLAKVILTYGKLV